MSGWGSLERKIVETELARLEKRMERTYNIVQRERERRKGEGELCKYFVRIACFLTEVFGSELYVLVRICISNLSSRRGVLKYVTNFGALMSNLFVLLICFGSLSLTGTDRYAITALE